MMLSHRPRILIADDHVLVAELFKNLLEPEYNVIGIVSDGREMIRVATECSPDLILLDVSMPLLNGLDAGQQVKKMRPAIKLLYLTMNHDEDVAAEAFRRGASGYLLKTCVVSELILAVRRVLRGDIYISWTLPKDSINYLRHTDRELVGENPPLTARQREVLQLLLEGKQMKEIAAILSVKRGTVAFHKYRIMEMLGAKSNADLVRYAIRNHIIGSTAQNTERQIVGDLAKLP